MTAKTKRGIAGFLLTAVSALLIMIALTAYLLNGRAIHGTDPIVSVLLSGAAVTAIISLTGDRLGFMRFISVLMLAAASGYYLSFSADYIGFLFTGVMGYAGTMGTFLAFAGAAALAILLLTASCFTDAYMPENRRAMVRVSAAAVLFFAMLIPATVYDQEISAFLTRSLPEGRYYSSDVFARITETVGFSLLYLLSAGAAVICFLAVLDMEEGEPFLFRKGLTGHAFRAVRYILLLGFASFALFESGCMIHEYFDYPLRFLREADPASADRFAKSPLLPPLELIIALETAILLLLVFRRLKKDDLVRLVSLSAVIFGAVIFYELLIETIKTPFGRARYRTMNVLGDFSYYTPWFVMSGERHLSAAMEVVSGPLPQALRFQGLSDTFKSYPSGHTYAAAVSFAAVCLPDLFESLNKKGIRILCTAVPAALTAAVGAGRVMSGAHYLSDVLLGGAAAILIVLLMRKLLITGAAEPGAKDG